jgi:thioredoxin-related protein
MKIKLLFLVLLNLPVFLGAQELFTSADIRNMDGAPADVQSLMQNTAGTILIFWEMNSTDCFSNLNNLEEEWLERLKNHGINLVAVYVDRQGNWSAVKPYVNGKGWEFDQYIDVNGNLKRSLGIHQLPHTVLVDNELNIQCSYPGYCQGDEVLICDKIIHCLETHGDLAGF